MASGAVFKLNCPSQMWFEQSCSLTRDSLFLSLFPVSYFQNISLFVSLPFPLCFFPSLFPYLSPVCASPILGMQIWICKCYGKRGSRCVTARTESGQHGRADMPCMQVKSVYNMAPRGHHTRARSLNGWTPRLVAWCEWEGPPLSVSQGRSRQENYASHEGVIFIHLCQNPSLPDNLSRRTVRQWTEFKRWVKLRTKIWQALCRIALSLSAHAGGSVKSLGVVTSLWARRHLGWDAAERS